MESAAKAPSAARTLAAPAPSPCGVCDFRRRCGGTRRDYNGSGEIAGKTRETLPQPEAAAVVRRRAAAGSAGARTGAAA